jgi:23S rRNA (guanosine2251-2'-O)-methyltransferase
MEILYGLHSVEEALRSGSRKFDHVCLARERTDQRLKKIQEACRDRGVRVRAESREQLTLLARNPGHQGVVAFVRERSMLDIEDIVGPAASQGEDVPLLLALDGVEDPQNLGALLRSAEGAGVSGVLLTERRSAPLSPIAVKTSAGAAEHVRLARVVNLVRAIEQVKAANIWCVGLDERGAVDYTDYDFTTPCMVVLGREGAGLHDLVRRTCDHLLRIPMAGRVASLNVAAAGAVVLYEAYRQRRRAAAPAASAKPAGAAKPPKGLGS